MSRHSVLHTTQQNPQFAAPIRTSDTLVLVCTYNERGSIEFLLDALLGLKVRCDVLVVDDSSTDGTLDVLAERAAADPRIGVIVRPRKLGLGSGLKLGWIHARRMGYARSRRSTPTSRTIRPTCSVSAMRSMPAPIW